MKILIAFLLLLLAGLQLRLWAGQGSLAQVKRLEDEIAAQEAENATLEQRNDVLVREVDELKTGMDAVEERARSELGMIREGETFYLIVEDEKEKVQEQEQTQR